MSDKQIKHTSSGRALAQVSAHKIGVDETLISNLVEAFYGKIQENEELGPIFNKIVAGNWEPHLAKMKDFWSSVTLYSGKYQGKPMPVHQQIEGIEPQNFEVWLGLFRETLEEIAPSQEVVEFFMLRAEQIANSLQAGIFR